MILFLGGVPFTRAPPHCFYWQDVAGYFILISLLLAGRLAQLEERLVYTQEVGSSRLSPPTKFNQCLIFGLYLGLGPPEPQGGGVQSGSCSAQQPATSVALYLHVTFKNPVKPAKRTVR